MERRTFLATVGAATSAVIAGCGGDGGPTATPTESGEVTATVELTDLGFDPRTVRIAVGEAVEWINRTGSARRIQAVTDEEVEGEVQDWHFGPAPESRAQTKTRNRAVPDGSTTRTFNEPGVYVFEDSISTQFSVCGAVLVGEDASLEGVTLPCESPFGT